MVLVIVASFIFCLLFFVFIGLLSSMKAQKNNSDYLLAGNSVPAWLVALSAVSTNNSGFMFIGQIGFTYQYGLSSIWLMIGWITGDFLASMLIHKKIRTKSEENNILSFGGVIANWYGENHKTIRVVVGLITIIFLGTYAGAQFKAGSKALHVLFGWDYSTGAIIGAIIVFLYCMAGGIRASIWTDAAQSFVMIGAMFILFVYALAEIGGFQDFYQALKTATPTYMNWFPDNVNARGWYGPILFVFGWFMAGFGVTGQPHVMIRFMTLDDAENMKKMRFYYYTWFISFYILAIGAGLAARCLIPAESFDPELALPMLSKTLLPDVLVGLMLAGIFAATMSTADSQILSCSAALTRDLLPPKWVSYLITKLGTVIVTIGALIIALYGPKSVFQLVLISWSFLASAFSPILVLYAFKVRINKRTLLTMMTLSVAVCLYWRSSPLADVVYEVAPGVVTGLVVFFIMDKLGFNKLARLVDDKN